MHRVCRGLMTLVMLATPGCGLTQRVVVGPTLDGDGELGVMLTASAGALVGPRRQVAVVVADGVGLGRGATPAWAAGAGLDWVPALPRGGAHPRGGRRLGLRGGWWRDDGRDQLGVELVGAATEPVSWHARFGFGIEAACGARTALDDTAVAPWTCRVGLALDAANADAVPAGTPIY